VTRQEIINKLFESMNVAKRGMHARMQTITNGIPVSHTQLELLFTIKHSQPVSFKQLAAQLQLTPGAVSQLADGLNQQDLIKRETDPNDRRSQSLQLSECGIELLQTVEKRRRDVIERVVQDLTNEELTVWLHIQEKMIMEYQSSIEKKPKKGEIS
jgi:DNA-binding MarR family transcriptional regulator